MARTKKGNGEADQRALVPWDRRMADAAAEAAKQEESAAGGQWFSTRAGILKFNGQPVPGSRMGVVILDSVIEHDYYADKFDPETPSAPACYAFGRDGHAMVPRPESAAVQHEACDGCPHLEWGSAGEGRRGKACQQRRRLALIAAATPDERGQLSLIDDPDHFGGTAIAYLKIPVTSVAAYATYVRALAATMKRAPRHVYTRITVQPDAKNQVSVTFDPLEKLPKGLLDVVEERYAQARREIEFPYPAGAFEPPAERPAKSAGKRKF